MHPTTDDRSASARRHSRPPRPRPCPASQADRRDRCPDDLPLFLTERDLARRWHVSTRSLQRWRRLGRGPAWLRLGRRVLYPVHLVRAHEAAALERGEGEA